MTRLTHCSLLITTISCFSAVAGCKTTQPQKYQSKHIFGRTAVSPMTESKPCEDGKQYLEAVRYIRNVAGWLMQKNPNTFAGPYAPGQFCFAVQDSQGMNASASVETKTIYVSTGLLEMNNAKDADIAAVLAHELAHITMQHKLREPDAVDLPTDYDPVEGKRRLDARAKWMEAVESSRKDLVIAADRNRIFSEAATLMRDRSILARLGTANPPQNPNQFASASKALTLLLAEYPEVIAAPRVYTLKSWQFLDRLSLHIDELMEASNTLSGYVQNGPELCLLSVVNLDCLDKKIMRHLIRFSSTRIKPEIARTCELELPAKDDPNHYAPYVQWTEQQADEVGFEFYLRAGFHPDRFTTYLEQMMRSESSFDACVDQLKQHNTTPNRTTSDIADAHPAFCFRYHDIKVAEMKAHDNDYKELLPAATLETIPGLDVTLDQARASFSERKP
jgi:hypothetical protein